jgi:hypothetical protein
MSEEYAAGVEAGRKTERQECWDAINQWIKRGELPGNGCDETAQRNGLILASNLIMERIGRTTELSDAELLTDY